MSAPMTMIKSACRAKRQQDELAQKAWQFIGCIERIYTQVGSHLVEMSALATDQGEANMLGYLRSLGTIPVVDEAGQPATVNMGAVCDEAEATIAALQQAWAGLSDEPFPALPDQPVTEEPAQ